MTRQARRPVPASTWRAFVGAMAVDLEPIRATIARIATLPTYGAIPADELVPVVSVDFSLGWRGLHERRLPAPDEDVSGYEQAGEQRARQGVTLEDMLQGWRLGIDAAREAAYRHAPQGPEREQLLLEAMEIMTAWATRGMHASATAHRRVELELARQEQHDLAGLVRRILFGAGGRLPRQGHLESYGIDSGGSFYAVRVRPHGEVDLAAIEEWLGTAESAARRSGLVAPIDGDVAGFVSALPANGKLTITAGVAGPVTLPQLVDAFRIASRALETAQALGRRGCVSLDDLGLAPAVLADDDVGRGVLERYVEPLERQGRSGAVVLDTVDRYLRNDSQVEPTARELGVHPNTVRYRVARFEQLTCSSLRSNETLVETWWALRRRAVA